ncbi:TPA: hypothetical protein UMX25_000051 [Stenotrophomonas maltophilia]|nr:hypothetical protein [Stenotrophomonas maltophilia]HEL4225084.1 hypothetical protein [Stenotrophomonas maltophilia]
MIDVERPPPLQQTFAPIATKVRPPIIGLPKETPPRLLREQEFAPCSAGNSPGCKSLVGGEKLIYRRSFNGVEKGPPSIELSQKLVHSLGLYWVEERSAFCRLNERGDIEDVIRVIWLKGPSSEPEAAVVTMLTRDLATYMALADMALVLKI